MMSKITPAGSIAKAKEFVRGSIKLIAAGDHSIRLLKIAQEDFDNAFEALSAAQKPDDQPKKESINERG